MKKHYFLDLKHLPWLLLLFVCSNLFAQTTITLPTACIDCKSSSNGTALVSSYGGAGCTPGSSGTLNGTYTVGQAVTSANTMTLFANVTQVGSWNITTSASNGVTFSGSGSFTATGCQSITLTASGTPATEGPLIAVTNTTPQGTAATTVQPVSNAATNGTAVVTNYGNSTCATGSVGTINGTLTQGVAVSGVTMSLYANVTQAGSWTLSASQNGVAFTGSGTFTITGCQLITLTGAGTPTNTGSTTFTTNTTPSGSATATVVAAFNPSKFIAAASGSLSGKTCFDIAVSNDNANFCGSLSSRASNKSDFSLSSVNTQTYTFTPSGTVSNVRFQYVNTNGQVITAITGGNAGSGITAAVTATVSYNTNLNTLALGLTGSNQLSADIYVIFNDGTADKILQLTVNIKDCACCGAFIEPGQFKEFMCWNLGADYTADPFTISPQIHGGKYFWGQKSPYLTQAEDATFSGSEGQGSSSSVDWSDYTKSPKDPCPAGYKVPSSEQWAGVIRNNSLSFFGTFGGSLTNFSAYFKFGNSLLLPAAGQRIVSLTFGTGRNGRGGQNISYWTSSIFDATNVKAIIVTPDNAIATSPNYNRGINNTALPIRCVKE